MTKKEMVKMENKLAAKRFLHCKRAQRFLAEWSETTTRNVGKKHRYMFLWKIGEYDFYLDRGYADLCYVPTENNLGENEEIVVFNCESISGGEEVDIVELIERISIDGTELVENYYQHLEG